MPPLETLRQAAAVLVKRHALWELSGAERSTGEPLRAAVAGPADLKDFLRRRAFREPVTEVRLGSVPLWWTPARAKARAPEADLLFWHLRPVLERFRRPGVLARLPMWVRLELDLRDPESLSRGKRRLKELGTAARKGGFAFELARDEASFADFFDRMYLPLVLGRHGEGASVDARADSLAALRSGRRRLVLLRREGVPAAGGTFSIDDGVLRFWQMGVRDGDPALLERGASAGMYWWLITHALEQGCSALNLGHCRPFVNDGLFLFKRLVGAHPAAARAEHAGSAELSVFRATPGARAFLGANPMIAMEAEGYRLYGFLDAGDPAAQASAAAWRDRYCFKDTVSLRLFDLAALAPTS